MPTQLQNMKLIKQLMLVFFKLCISLSLFGLVYIVQALNYRLDTYSVKNDKYKGNIDVEYNENTISFENSKENNKVQNFIACYEEPIKAEDFSKELKDKLIVYQLQYQEKEDIKEEVRHRSK